MSSSCQRRWVNAIRMNDVDSVMLSRAEIRKRVPILSLQSRFPVVGGFTQPRAGISRHDAVVWGFARAASALGVDIIQGCEVLGFDLLDGEVRGVQTSRGRIGAERLVMSVAGHSSVLARLAGIRLPITTMTLQAMVTEPVKPVLDSIVISAAVHAYVSQSDRGEIVIGGGADVYNSYAQRGGLPLLRSTIAATLELFPSFSRLRLMRQWAGGCRCDAGYESHHGPDAGAKPVHQLRLGVPAVTRPFLPAVTPWRRRLPPADRIR